MTKTSIRYVREKDREKRERERERERDSDDENTQKWVTYRDTAYLKSSILSHIANKIQALIVLLQKLFVRKST